MGACRLVLVPSPRLRLSLSSPQLLRVCVRVRASALGHDLTGDCTPLSVPAVSAPAATTMSVQCPSYISARSAEVILSDVRPIKLKPDALHSINVLLDETLYSILVTARSLATDRLKAALLKVLPTSLGKEALLEAEVELKAYWDRTGTARPPPSGRGADAKEFDLQWSFEVSMRIHDSYVFVAQLCDTTRHVAANSCYVSSARRTRR